MATTTGYDVDASRYVTDRMMNSSGIGDVMTTTTGYDVNGAQYVTEGAINSSGIGDVMTTTRGYDVNGPLLSSSGCLVVNTSALQPYDDSDDPVSSATVHLFTRVKGTVLIPMLFFIGFPTNCLNLLVFFKHGLKQRINLCLFCLSLVDLVYIAFLFIMYAQQIRPGNLTGSGTTAGTVVAFIINNHVLGFSGFAWASMFVSAIISSERCFCVIWPLRSRTLLKTETTAVVLLVGVVTIAGGRFAITEKYRVVCLYDVASGQESFQLTVSQYYLANKRLVDVLDGVVYGMVVPITTCSVVTMATVVTAVKLRKVAQWRQESSSALSAPEVAVTRMLIYLSVQFIALNFPNVLFRVSSVFIPDLNSTGRFAKFYYIMVGVVEVCMAFNSSLNFLVYYFAGTKYRQTVHGLCGKAATKKKTVCVDTSVSNVNTAS